MAAFDGTYPATFVVPDRVKKGAIVRAGCELDTDLVGTLDAGTELVIAEAGKNKKGTVRYRLTKPVEGWVSDKSVEWVAPPEPEPVDPETDPEAFMAQSPLCSAGAVLFKVSGGVGVVTLNQPENNNALSAAIFIGLLRCVKYAYEHVGSLRVVFVKSSGRIWCAGGDPKDFQKAQAMVAAGGAGDPEDNDKGAHEFAGRLKYINECPVPLIGLIAGPVFGGGVGIASVFDMVVCTERAVFQLSEVKLGVIPATISPYVVQAMGVRASRRFFITGEPMPAAVCKDIGFVSEVVKDVRALEEAAQKICDNFTLAAPKAVAASKALVQGVAFKVITDDVISYTADQLAKIRVDSEAVDGMVALLAKKKPPWAADPLKVKL